mgnify:CR=1 FL=1
MLWLLNFQNSHGCFPPIPCFLIHLIITVLEFEYMAKWKLWLVNFFHIFRKDEANGDYWLLPVLRIGCHGLQDWNETICHLILVSRCHFSGKFQFCRWCCHRCLLCNKERNVLFPSFACLAYVHIYVGGILYGLCRSFTGYSWYNGCLFVMLKKFVLDCFLWLSHI